MPQFDECSPNEWLAHSFTNLPSHISRATLRFKAQACAGGPENDAISLVFAKPGGVLRAERWTRRFGKVGAADGLFGSNSWSAGSIQEIELDLSALPNGDDSTTNLLAVLRAEHSLDILVQANTAVDYLQLTIETCQCGPDIVACKSANTNGAVVTFPAPAFTDNCGSPAVACVPASGSFFPVGDTTVTCTASDLALNRATCVFVVTVTPDAASSPVLRVTRQGNDLEIKWPVTCETFQLEAAPTLNQPVPWAPVSSPPILSGGYYRVPITPSAAERFFRLRGP